MNNIDKRVNWYKKFNWRRFTQLLAQDKSITLSTYITFSRFILTPIIVGSMIIHCWGLAFVLFIIAVLTDIFDGLLARLLNNHSFLGAVLDPLADKLLILSCFGTLACIKTPLFALPRFFVLFVLTKEIIQVMGALYIYCRQGYLEIQPTRLGKLTMVVHSGFIIWLFFCYFFQWMPIKTYYTMLALVMILVSVALIDYICIGFRMLIKGN